MPFVYNLFDYYYIVLVLPVIIASLIIQFRLKSTYAKYSKIGNARRITGAQAAYMVLQYYGITDVNIMRIGGNLSDCYDPTQKVIKLSEDVFNGSSVAAVGIACHEAGHAAQHAENYAPIKFRNLILPVCNIGSALSIPLLIAGVIFSFEPLVWIGIGFFAFTAVFQLATLPVEFNASRRAINVIQSNNLLTFEEKAGAQKVLKMAAMTYVAALAVSLAQLLRLILRFTGRRR
ncbi:MAG: zinc metallopeptidase [Clostridia bacterium]|nr:zinc metallopeptidase [Clostridia bacterium]